MSDEQQQQPGEQSTSQTFTLNQQQATGQQPPPQQPPETPKEPEVKRLELTQDQLDAIIQERLAREKKRHDTELEQLRQQAGKTESEKLQMQLDSQSKQFEQQRTEWTQMLVKQEAKLAATAENAKQDRVDAVVRNADLSECVDQDGKVDPAKVADAVKKVLSEYPEWRTVSKSGGDLNLSAGGITLETFRKMPYAQRVELYEKNPDLYRRLADQEFQTVSQQR